jgi:hypothetical protein
LTRTTDALKLAAVSWFTLNGRLADKQMAAIRPTSIWVLLLFANVGCAPDRNETASDAAPQFMDVKYGWKGAPDSSLRVGFLPDGTLDNFDGAGIIPDSRVPAIIRALSSDKPGENCLILVASVVSQI